MVEAKPHFLFQLARLLKIQCTSWLHHTHLLFQNKLLKERCYDFLFSNGFKTACASKGFLSFGGTMSLLAL